jgi:hypothetical protein
VLLVWFGALIAYVIGYVVQAAVAEQVVTGMLQPMQILPISGYILCVFVPLPGAARNLALANLGAVAVGLGVAILAQHAERHAKALGPAPAAAAERPTGSARPERKAPVVIGLSPSAQCQCLLWAIQSVLLTSYLHVVARSLEARQLAESSARAMMLAVGCAILVVLAMGLGLLAPSVVVLWILLAAVLAVICFLWQGILLLEAYQTLTRHLDR